MLPKYAQQSYLFGNMGIPSQNLFYSTPNHLAPIELIPVEITQNVFLQILDLNFPLASHIIAVKLADKYIYRHVCDYAFGHEIPFDIAKPKHRSTCEIKLYQSQLFALRWMRWEFFQDHTSQRMAPWACGYHCDDKGGKSGVICNCTFPDCQLRRRGDETSTLLPKIYRPIPQKLLHGPWTDDKIKFLNGLLRMSTMSVDWTDKDAVRIAVKGKREAILQRNLDAVHLFSRVRRLGKAPNIELVKFAVMEAGCDRSVVFDLIVAAMDWGHRRWNDVELDQWVVKKEREGDLKGR